MTASQTGTESGEPAPVRSPEDHDDLVVASNRQPYRHYYDEDGEISVDRPVGGLTAGLDPVLRRTDGTWIAWGDGEADEVVTDERDSVRVPPEGSGYTLKRIWLSDEQVADYYYGYSNRVLWPLCHGFVGKIVSETGYWERYRDVNETFADAIVSRADEGSIVWLNDYHFALAPHLIAGRLPATATLVQFWHIPWPSWDTLRVAPHRRSLLRGLLGNDLIGFHVEEYCANFLECVESGLDDVHVDWATGTIYHGSGTTVVGAFPMGVDAEEIDRTSRNTPESFWPSFRERFGVAGSTVAVGVDRLDYTKGIPQRIAALERLWASRPEWRGELTYVQKESESRSRIPEYQELQDEVDAAVARVNERFGTDEWTPIVRIDERLSNRDLYGLYRHSDLCLVSPLRDGMNLVAKEYVAAQVDGDGALLLSELAGAHADIGEYALSVNPYDADSFAAQIERALTMDECERRDRLEALRSQVFENDLHAWLADLFEAADAATETEEEPGLR